MTPKPEVNTTKGTKSEFTNKLVKDSIN